MNKTLTNKAGNLVLELRQETMSAWLTIKNSGKLIDEMEILNLVEEAGIKTGFDEAMRYIRENSLEKEFDIPFPIAICNIGESETTLRYHFNPDLNPDISTGVSFTDIERLRYVQAGDVVADYSSNLFEQGGSIYDIFGELINPGSIDEEQANALAGLHVRYDASNREFLATKTGYPFIDELGRICLLDSLTLKGDEIPGEAVIHTPLNVLVQGGLAWVNLICGGSLEVKGDLHNCEVFTEGDLCVEGEIVSCQGNGIVVHGCLTCSGIRDSVVLCKQSLKFSGVVENSNIACEGDLHGDHDNSCISGGLTQAGGCLSVAEIGTEGGADTEIEIAISPYYRAWLMKLTRELIKHKEDPEANSQAIHELQNRIKNSEHELDEQLNSFLKRPSSDRKSVIIHNGFRAHATIRVLKHSYEFKALQPGLELLERE